MNIRTKIRPTVSSLVLAIAASLSTSAVADHTLEFEELKVLIEMNATDGDVGFHALADAGPWWWMRLDDPNLVKLLTIKALNGLRTQGLTENFFESSEPLCEADEEEPDERVQTLAEFLELFPEGNYLFRAANEEDQWYRGEAELTYNLPAAPDISATDEMELDLDDAVIMWGPGVDLGEKCHDQSLVDDGTIADPAMVEVVGWEVVVEVDDDDAPERTYTAQVPAGQNSVTVPEDFLQQFIDLGFTEFKFEVGAIEESGNQTITESFFCTDPLNAVPGAGVML